MIIPKRKEILSPTYLTDVLFVKGGEGPLFLYYSCWKWRFVPGMR